MKLRGKMALFLGLSFLLVFVLLYALQRTLILNRFDTLEEESIENDLKAARGIIEQRLSQLGSRLLDWGKWDDMYSFVAEGGKNQEFVRSNMPESLLGDLDVSIFLIVGADGSVLFNKSFDHHQQGVVEEIPPNTLQALVNDSVLAKKVQLSSPVLGIKVIADKIYLLGSRSVTKSDDTGDFVGNLIFGREFNADILKGFAEISGALFSLETVSSFTLKLAKKGREVDRPQGRKVKFIRSLSGEMYGYQMIEDITGSFSLLLSVVQGKNLFSESREAISSIIVFISALALLLGLALMVLLDELVIKRISRLNRQVAEIALSGDHSLRVSAKGNDELGELVEEINSMLSSLQSSEQLIRSRNSQMRMLMNAVPLGLVSIDNNNKVSGEYSKFAYDVLGSGSLEGRDYLDLLGLKGKLRVRMTEFLQIVREGRLSEKVLAEINPVPETDYVRTEDRDTWLRLRYYGIAEEDTPRGHILVVMEDVTEEKSMSARALQAERENMQLKAMAQDPEVFREFLCESLRLLRRASQELRVIPKSPEVVHQIFRDIHIIKGSAGSFGLMVVSEITHQLENYLSTIREAKEGNEEVLRKASETLTFLTRAIKEVVDETSRIMGEEITADSEVQLRLPVSRLEHEIRIIERDLSACAGVPSQWPRAVSKAVLRLRDLRKVSARKALSAALRFVPSLAERLGKEVELNLHGMDRTLDIAMVRHIQAPVSQILRNCLEHGIEYPEERLSVGKPPAGELTVSVLTHATTMEIVISDDGKGLDPQKLRKAAVERGLISESEAAAMTDAQTFDLIYMQGFSTLERASEVSGRGVGMNAIKAVIEEKMFGSIKVESALGKGCKFTLEFPDLLLG